MITERAQVLRIENDTAWLQCASQAGCQRCAEGRGCGGGLFSRLLRGRLQEIPVNIRDLPAGESLAINDWVMLGLEPSAVQNAAFLMYGLPLALLMTGIIAGDGLAGDAGALTGAVIGLAGGFMLARTLAGKLLGNGRLQPRILYRLNPGEPCPQSVT